MAPVSDPPSPSNASSRSSAPTPSSTPSPSSGRIVAIAGPPSAVEVGQQHQLIVQRYGFVPISAASLLTEHVQRGTKLGVKAKEYISRKERVPSDLMVGLLQHRIKKRDVVERGCLLDGFPLSLEHADAMKGKIAVDQFLVIDVSDETIVERCVNRRFDPKTATTYHLKLKPPPLDVMPQLVQKVEDSEEMVLASLKEFHSVMHGIAQRLEGSVHHIDAMQHPDAVFGAVCECLGPVPVLMPAVKIPRVVVVGGPLAVGKEMQCKRIVKKLGLVHVSAKSLLSKHVKRGSEVGAKAREYMSREERVPSDLIVGLLKDRISKSDILKRGCLLEDFPLCSEHARAMQGQIEVDSFLYIDAPDAIIVERCMKHPLDPRQLPVPRMGTVCEPECESSPPNASSPPSAAAPSAKSGDSVEEKAQVQARLKAYRESAEELLVHFQDKVRRIDGAQPPDAVFGAISACLGRAPARTVVEVPPPRRGRTVAVVTPPCGAQRFPCERIADKLGLVHVSAGKLLVKHMQRETAAGMKTKEYIDRQERVPSELIVSLFKERMNKKDARQRGCLLDGFPLSPDHAEAMKGQIEVDCLFLVEVPDEDHIESLVNRRVDPKTGIVYTLKSSPPPAKVMKRVVQSGYDTEEKVRARLKQYHASVDAILPYFEGKVRRIDGTQQKDVLIDAIRGAVAGRPEKARREDATRHWPKPRGAMRSVAHRARANLQQAILGRAQRRQGRRHCARPHETSRGEAQRILSGVSQGAGGR